MNPEKKKEKRIVAAVSTGVLISSLLDCAKIQRQKKSGMMEAHSSSSYLKKPHVVRELLAHGTRAYAV
jgi:hypothetical protein